MLATGGAKFEQFFHVVLFSSAIISKIKFFKFWPKIQSGQMSYFSKQKFLRHQSSPKNPNLSAYVHILHTFCGDRCQTRPGVNWSFLAFLQKSRFLTFLRKSPKCAMNVAHPPNERVNVALSGSRNRYPSYFVDFAQILIKNVKNRFFGQFQKILLMHLQQQKSKKLYNNRIVISFRIYFI